MARQSDTAVLPRPVANAMLGRNGARRSMNENALRSERNRAYRALARRDDAIAQLIAQHGRPDPFSWDLLDDTVGGAAFPELVLHIVSQQLSTVAALAIYSRVQTVLGGTVEPNTAISTPVEELREAGLSGAKARSLRDLAGRIIDGRLDLQSLATADDETVEAELLAVLGIGPWSAQMFLLHYYRRPDVMPAADVGLLRAAQSAFAQSARPTAEELCGRAQGWRPYRSYGAALLWAHGRDVDRTTMTGEAS